MEIKPAEGLGALGTEIVTHGVSFVGFPRKFVWAVACKCTGVSDHVSLLNLHGTILLSYRGLLHWEKAPPVSRQQEDQLTVQKKSFSMMTP